ncbi:MAG: hypothetical protein LBK95_07160 [Bifidobacteriaceae bacterium]|jgi:hypothetical protein|nr:hypothetical protein [Bifidobacteriaceae bacterium]
MNLVDGRVVDGAEAAVALETLDERIAATLSRGTLDPDVVIEACDRLVAGLDLDRWTRVAANLGVPEDLAQGYIAAAREAFSGPALRRRLERELGADRAATRPLGTLLHIAAGNMDGLPAFSLIEGLLAGNINLLKLPAAEGGLSVTLLQELVATAPALGEYIYVFDYSSRDVTAISELIAAADAVVVWGGDAAVTALRGLVGPNTRLIEWGHKVSFGYVTSCERATDGPDGLGGLAANMVQTGQALCSSCQGIFVDTDSPEQVDAFCERFLPVLERAFREHGADLSGAQGAATLELYTAELEAPATGGRVFRGHGCGLIARSAGPAEPAPAPGVAWVKPLPRDQILRVLRPHKNHLQTVGLVCAPEERAALAESFWRAGAVRVVQGASMSTLSAVSPHDGDYPLRRYTKLVELA